MSDSPAARGVRLNWDDVPHQLKAVVEQRLGAPIVAATTQPLGFSPGIAVRLQAANGRRIFVKAVSPRPNRDSPAIHRREAQIVANLPTSAPVPRLLWSHDEGVDGWILLAFEDIDGRPPILPWRPVELGRVLTALAELAAALSPAPASLADIGGLSDWYAMGQLWWQALRDQPPPVLDAWSHQHAARLADLEATAALAAQGTTLLHLDVRADNLLLLPDRVLFVDWPHARLGAAWVDLLFFAPSVTMQGGPAPEELMARFAPARQADPAAINAVVAAIAGFFTYQELQPAPPGLPTLRVFQAAQGRVARLWLAERLGLPPPAEVVAGESLRP